MSLTAHRTNNVFHVEFGGVLVDVAFSEVILAEPTSAYGSFELQKIRTEIGLEILTEETTKGSVIEQLTAHRVGLNTFHVVGAVST